MRLRAHQWVVLSAWASKAVSAVIQIAVIRLIIDRIGLDLYAAVALLTGLAGWYALADFGIGTSLQNHVSEQRAREASADGILLTGLLLALGVLVVLMVVQHLLAPWLGPLLLGGISRLDDAARTEAFRLFGQLSLVATGSSLVYKIWYATQKGYFANIVPAAAAAAGYIAIGFVPASAPPDQQLLWCLVALGAPTALLPLPFAIAQAVKAWRAGGRFSGENTQALAKRAASFVGLATMAASVLQIDYIVISQFLPAADIVTYNISMKVFGTAFFIYYSVLLAFWPLLTEMITRGEWEAVRAKVRQVLGSGIAFMAGITLFVALFERQILALLAPSAALTIGVPVIVLLGVYFALRIWTDTFSTVLGSMSRVGPLLKWVPVQAALNLGLQVYLAPKFGVAGVVVALILAFALTVSWVLPHQVATLWSQPPLQGSAAP